MTRDIDPYQKFEKFSNSGKRKKNKGKKRFDDDNWGTGKKKEDSFTRREKRVYEDEERKDNRD